MTIGDIEKMSKSKRNVVAPADIADTYGVDAARLCVLSDSPPERDVQWTSAGVDGAWRLVQPRLDRVRRRAGDRAAASRRATAELRQRHPPGDQGGHRRHRGLRASTAPSPGCTSSSAWCGAIRRRRAADARREALSALARLIAPFAPHLAEECWRRLGEPGPGRRRALARPIDPALAEDDERVLPVQINGKRRGEIRAGAGASEAEVEKIVLDDPEIARRLEGLSIRRVIVVKDRIVNIVAA